VGFEPLTPVNTVYALHRVTTVIDCSVLVSEYLLFYVISRLACCHTSVNTRKLYVALFRNFGAVIFGGWEKAVGGNKLDNEKAISLHQ
jgi:hypothetical protein